MNTDQPKTGTLTSWPAVAGLGLVTLLIIGMIGLDVYFSEKESLKTTDIMENAQISMVLLNDIRLDVKHVAATTDPREIDRWMQVIVADSRSYDPIATYEGERDEW